MKYYIRHVRTGKYLKAFILGDSFFTKDKRLAVRADKERVHDLLKMARSFGKSVTFEAVK